MMQPKRWWWVRHGPTNSRTLAGWTDVQADLSDHEKLQRLEGYLPVDAIVVSSNLSRAIATADAICGNRSRLPHSGELRELNFGLWEGLTSDEIAERYPELSTAFWRNPRSATPPDGEHWEDLATRVSKFADRLSGESLAQDFIAVAHFGAILTQIERSVEGGIYEALAQRLDYLSVTRIDHTDGNWSLVEANRTF